MELSAKENYYILTGSIIPRPVAFVTTLSKEGVINGAPFSYFSIVASDPPMVSISVQRSDGNMKDTARNAIDMKEFVVHISDESYIHKINETAKELPYNESEIEYTGLTSVPSTVVAVPGVKEASIRMECVMEKYIPLGATEENPACELLIGRIVQYHIHDELFQEGRIDPKKLLPVSRLAGNNYEKLGEIFELKRPK